MPTRQLDGIPPLFVYRAILALRTALFRLLRRLVPPRVVLFEQFTGVWHTQMIYAAARLGLADHLADGPRTVAELAVASGANADALFRLLRALVSVGVFRRERDGRFALNPVAATLRTGTPDSMRDIVLFIGSPHSMAGWAHFYDAVRTGRNGFQLANGKPVFEYFAEHPEAEREFGGGMVSMTELEAPALVRGFDYGRFTSICDVGGGRGVLLAAIVSVNPGLRGVLFDAASVTAEASTVFRDWGVQDRCSTQAGSFFDAVPVGFDAYVLKEIVHDWDDARASAILAVCRRAMQPGATLLVIEMVLTDDDEPHPGKLLDLEMLDTTQEGRQRSEPELRRLLEQAGFALVRVVALPTPSSIVEAVAV